MAPAASPLPIDRLREITSEACIKAFEGTTHYQHEKAETWNSSIISTVLQKLIDETSSDRPPPYKFIVNTTIIQHLLPGEDGSGKRGMHAASSAYWNNDKDGMWSYKWAGAEDKGIEVVVMVTWIAM